MIEVIELNCKIFRCGIYKDTFQQINPHMIKDDCDNLVKNNLIFGCSKPFMVIVEINEINKINTEYNTVICDYI
jgi:hypothetical protein